jgi:Mor family transcriptional regulator
MIKRHFEDGQSISDLSKLFHLSYSTIAHILKTFKEKNVVFESKRSKLMREI